MTDLATLTKKGDVSIIKLDDGKANAFSLDMLESLDCSYVIVGHSERRLLLDENDAIVKKKFDSLAKTYIDKFVKKPTKNPKGKNWIRHQKILKKRK